jgi:hypothetical protein
VVFVSGAFHRAIPVADLEHLARTGEVRGLLADVLRICTTALERVARILYPLKTPAVGVPAQRAATILGLERGDGSLSPLGVLEAYPNRDLAVNLPQLQIAPAALDPGQRQRLWQVSEDLVARTVPTRDSP